MKNVVMAAVLAVFSSAQAAAQDGKTQAAPSRTVGVGVTGGTLGIGPEVSLRGKALGVRGNATFFDFNRTFRSEGIDYSGDLSLKSYGAVLDIYLGQGGFRASAGARVNKNRVDLTSTPTTDVQVGGVTFTPEEVGVLSGDVTTNKLSPTVTLGYGGGNKRGVNFSVDAGAMLQGSPLVQHLNSTGSLAAQPEFQATIERERLEVNEDLRKYKVYPVLQLGLGYRF